MNTEQTKKTDSIEREYMAQALTLASAAYDLGEVPVGAVIVEDATGEVIGQGYNRRESLSSAISHAEILAIEEACRSRGDWRLTGCTLYVTLEPCPMCAGALINCRIDRVVYGARDMAAGCCGSLIDLVAYPFNHAFAVKGGVCEEECGRLLRDFFKQRRSRIE